MKRILMSPCNNFGLLSKKIKHNNCEKYFKRFVRLSLHPETLPDLGEIQNEPVLNYKENSKERLDLTKAITKLLETSVDIPIVVGDEEIKTNEVHYQVMPHMHSDKIAKYYHANSKIINKAINTAIKAQQKWDKIPFMERILIWKKASNLMATKYRQELNAATMLGQGKTVHQAEIDSGTELVDFFRFNAYYLTELLKSSNLLNPDSYHSRNIMRYRGLEGFVASITPFNFTAISGNMTYTPVLMGCSVLWKPSDSSIISNWLLFNIMKEAGLPSGVVNFIPAHPDIFTQTVCSSPYLAGINYTGSVKNYYKICHLVDKNLENYRNYPRLIGECSGKNYHFVHPSADIETVVSCTIRAAFEYSGQKCSACSCLYIPELLSTEIKDRLCQECNKLSVGKVTDFCNFTSAVINKSAFDRITLLIDTIKGMQDAKILAGGRYYKQTGYYILPTIVETVNPSNKLLNEEIFGPILTIYVYKDKDLKKIMETLASTNFALTGSVFARDEDFLNEAVNELKLTAGNFYINDKCTGAVVGQQPFGGSRLSGTNDKAGGKYYILKWTSPQCIKETFIPLKDIDYPHMISS